MSFLSLVRRLRPSPAPRPGSRPSRGRCAGTASRRRRAALGLETLEDRCVPAVFNVIGTADGLLPVTPTAPGVFTASTLRSAIQAANATPGNNLINLVVPGDYRITIPGANTGTNASGAFAILPNAAATPGGTSSLTIRNASHGGVSVDGGGLDRVFDINPADTTPAGTAKFSVTLTGFTILNGRAADADNPDGPNGSGGGIRDQGPVSLTLTSMVITNNSATADGGGVSMENGASTPWTLTVTNSTISNNHAGDAGGGLETDGSGRVVVSGTTIVGNTTVNQGAGIWLDAVMVTVGDATVDQAAILSVDRSLILNNTAVNGPGGGIGNAGNNTFIDAQGNVTQGTTTITNSTLANNFSGTQGGGFADQNGQGTLNVLNSTVVGNVALGDGGGIQEGGLVTTINDSTVTGNTTQGMGGGLSVQSPAFVLNNTIVADNFSNGVGGMNFLGMAPDVFAAATSAAGDFIGIGDANLTGITDGTGDNHVGTAANPLEPLLGPLQNNGGPTPTEAPLPGSPVIDTGLNSVIPAGTMTDQRGLPRIVNGTVDVGAVEVQAALPPGPAPLLTSGPHVFNVTSLADSLTPVNGHLTLRAAIQAADNSPGGNVINLAVPGDYRITIPGANTGTNASGAFTILPTGGNLTIVNTSGGAVTVDGGGLDRVFDINPNPNPATPKFTVTLEGFTILNGRAADANNPDGPNGSGGGIRDQGNASLTLINMEITNNSATADGGGVAMENGASTPWTLTVTNSTISNNHAGDAGGGLETDGSGKVFVNPGTVITGNTTVNQGAGIWLDAVQVGTVVQSANLTVTGALVGNNTAVTGPGGGIGNAGNGAVIIANSALVNNFAGMAGGGFGDQNNQGTLTVFNSTIVGNVAVGNGGAVQEAGPSTSISASTVTGNTTQGEGGGLSVQSPNFFLVLTLVAGNFSNGVGGMNFLGTAPDVLANVTFAVGDFIGIGDGGLTGVVTRSPLSRVGTTANPLNPLLGPLQTNGGLTPTELPLPGSPAVDVGAHPSLFGFTVAGVPVNPMVQLELQLDAL